jgi:hypothetical protein
MYFPKYFTPKRIVQGVGNFLKIQHIDVIQYDKIEQELVVMRFIYFWIVKVAKNA